MSSSHIDLTHRPHTQIAHTQIAPTQIDRSPTMIMFLTSGETAS